MTDAPEPLHPDEIVRLRTAMASWEQYEADKRARGRIAAGVLWLLGIVAAAAAILHDLVTSLWPLHKAAASLSVKGKVAIAAIGAFVLGRAVFAVVSIGMPVIPEIPPIIGRMAPLPIWNQADTFPAVLHAHTRFDRKGKYHDPRVHSL